MNNTTENNNTQYVEMEEKIYNENIELDVDVMMDGCLSNTIYTVVLLLILILSFLAI